MRLLLEAGAVKDAATTDGATALHMAAQESQLEVVQLLIESGADKDAAATDDRATALCIAAKKGHSEVVLLLLEAGTDKDAANAKGVTALHIAAKNCHSKVVRLLLEAGAKKMQQQQMGQRPCRSLPRMGILKLCVCFGAEADKDAATTDGATALYILPPRAATLMFNSYSIAVENLWVYVSRLIKTCQGKPPSQAGSFFILALFICLPS